MNDDKLNASRYEYIRTLSPVQFAEIFKENVQTGQPFDDLVDERRTAAASRARADAWNAQSTQAPVKA